MNKIPSLRSVRWKLWLLGVFKIPLIGFCRPRLIELNDENCTVKIRLTRRTKNHLNSMYFGALMVGADLCAGLQAFAFSVQEKKKVSLAFKSCESHFIKRAGSSVYFKCTEGTQIRELMQIAEQTGERQNKHIHINAFDESGELVAEVSMELSVKVVG
jgi:acyl-coenzyme A thioesterase PaaI-like protein